MATHQHEQEKSNLGVGLVGMAAGLVWVFIVGAIAYWIAAH
jgi:hypothetical protein